MNRISVPSSASRLLHFDAADLGFDIDLTFRTHDLMTALRDRESGGAQAMYPQADQADCGRLKAEDKDAIFRDSAVAGFGVRVHTTGRRLCIVRSRGPA